MLLDLLFLAGFASAAVGLWWIYPPAALIIPGSVVCILASFGVANERRRKQLARLRRDHRSERMRILKQEGQASDYE